MPRTANLITLAFAKRWGVDFTSAGERESEGLVYREAQRRRAHAVEDGAKALRRRLDDVGEL